LAKPIPIADNICPPVFKQVFQFIAPASARRLVSAVSSLQIALGQVHNNLTDPKFHAEAGDQNIRRVDVCLGGFISIYDQIRVYVDQSQLGARQEKVVQENLGPTQVIISR